jgi:hypothetical protein
MAKDWGLIIQMCYWIQNGRLENAWCDKCDEVLQREGEWNDKSESFAGIMAVCEGCFEEIKKRNER